MVSQIKLNINTAHQKILSLKTYIALYYYK
ncbi:MAG: hypothetical protein QG673_1768 [Pseudomonadota bacterium]|nr:hypothetical protein [Pseudomonadota bacterium]